MRKKGVSVKKLTPLGDSIVGKLRSDGQVMDNGKEEGDVFAWIVFGGHRSK